MSLNPPLTTHPTDPITPTPYPNEYFFLSRPSINFSVSSPTSETYKSVGQVFITSNRICLIPNRCLERPLGYLANPTEILAMKTAGGVEWCGIDVPLHLISSHRFRQPIFGANYIEGMCSQVPNGGFASEVKWRLTFRKGGVGTFLSLFMKLMKYVEASANENRNGVEMAMAEDDCRRIQEGFQDPNDPSVMFI